MTIAVSTQTRPTPDLVILVGGQSLADFLTYTGAGDAFIAALRTHSDTPDLSGALAFVELVEAGDSLVKPANPYGFRVEQSGSQVPVASMAWSGNDLLLTLASPVTTPDLFFPYDFVADFDPAKTITGSVSGKPLQSWYRA